MFYSILFRNKEQYERYEQTKRTVEPDCFKDLNLDQIFAPILKSKKEFELEGFFYTSLHDAEIITYRQHVMRELENDELRGLFVRFSKTIYNLDRNMTSIRTSLTSDSSYDNNYLTRGWMLDCADRYCSEISALVERLNRETLRSEGLRTFAEYLSAYSESEAFKKLCTRVAWLREEFSSVEYCMLIKNGTIRVRKYEGEADLSKEILACFEKFRQGEVKDYRQRVIEEPAAVHVEAAVLDMLAGLYKNIFADLNSFCKEYIDFLDPTITRFAREIQFYLSWLDYILPLREVGLPFNYPKLCDTAEHLYGLEVFDLALAFLKRDKTVTNDFVLNSPERIIVVTGPNQGGKTTFARAFGQVHWLASLGLCVPGREATLYLFDNILTHFAREEDLSTLNGRLQDDLVRLHGLFEKTTSQSIIIINEIFSSTTLSDAIILGGYMMDAISELRAIAVVVTFLDELATRGPDTVSMMSTVKENDPTQRTYKIVRKPPDGLAYAIHLASKYRLTYDQLVGRLKK
jgi:DNA mismatch repair ATPase MutS